MAHRILFVCLGNICRSPLAEGAFRAKVEEAGSGEAFVIDSAGTGGWHVGAPPDARAQAMARARGIDISGQRARRVGGRDFEAFDLILAMDDSNVEALKRIAPDGHDRKIELLLNYASAPGPREVPDPYYGGPDGFERVFAMVDDAARGLLRALQGERKG